MNIIGLTSLLQLIWQLRSILFCLNVHPSTLLHVGICTVVTSVRNNGVIWIGWKQKCKQVSWICLSQNVQSGNCSLLKHIGFCDQWMAKEMKTLFFLYFNIASCWCILTRTLHCEFFYFQT